MQKRNILNWIMVLFVCVMFMPVMADSEPVNGEPALKKVLADIGITSAGDNATAITKAKEFVISRQAQKKRDVIFKSPVTFEEINQKYLTINYDVEIKSGTPGVVSLLFERSGDKIVFAEGKYLLWVGPDDMKEYKTISTEKVCDYYRKLGANDCFPVVTHSKLTRSFALKADIKHTHSGEEINSGIIKEQYIDDAIARDSEVKALIANIAATKAAVAPAPAPVAHVAVPALKPGAVFIPNPESSPNERIAYLEAEVKRLSELLKDVTKSNDTMIFNNMNVQILNGSGNTESANGRGNLIVGYNSGGSSRSGSHNVVVGSKNSYSSYGGVIAGSGNTASGKFTSVIGGASNTAQGDHSVVVGGEKNNASGAFAIIAGGVQRSATTVNPHFSNQ